MLTNEEKIAVAKACRLLRTVYDISAKKMANEMGYTTDYLLHIETNIFANKLPSLEACKKIANCFELDLSQLVEIGNDCKTPIETVLYLQKTGLLNDVKN